VDQSFDQKALVANTVYNVVSIATTAAMAIPTFISIAVFAHPKLKDPAFKILLTVAIVDFSYMCLLLLNALMSMYCEPMPFMCGSNAQLFAFITDQLIMNYLTSSMALYSILCEIFLTVQRMLLLKNITLLKNVTVRTAGPVFGIISLVYYSPYWFAYDFVTTDNVYVYRNQTYVEWNLVANDFGKSAAYSWLLSALSIFRMILVLVVLLVLNIVSVIFFRKHFSRRVTLVAGGNKKKFIVFCHLLFNLCLTRFHILEERFFFKSYTSYFRFLTTWFLYCGRITRAVCLILKHGL
jgi:hypothetical protein